MFFLGDIFLTKEQRQRRKELEELEKRRRLAEPFLPWDPKMRWRGRLNIQAETYKPDSLFRVRPHDLMASFDINKCEFNEYVDSPGGKFRYVENILPKGETLKTWSSNRIGNVMFDGDVVIPALYQWDQFREEFSKKPWMSFTPAEFFSLRAGIGHAKGTVVVAGLGLGYQLQAVARKRNVKKIYLVELSEDLVDFVLPRLDIQKPVEVIVGDAYEEVPKLEADVALIDIFPSYGNNDWPTEKIRMKSDKIDFVWGWGTAIVRGY